MKSSGPDGVADFTTVSAGVRVVVTVAVLGLLSTPVLASEVPVASAVFVTVPASMSAWVSVYAAVQVVFCPTASVVAAQFTAPSVPVPLNADSRMPSPETATLPVFVTANE